MNYNLMIANCICDSSIKQDDLENNTNINYKNKEEKHDFKSITKSVIANLLAFNIDIIKCYNFVFNWKYLKDNIGFYCMTIMFIIQLVCFFIYVVKKLKALKSFMLKFKKNIILLLLSQIIISLKMIYQRI